MGVKSLAQGDTPATASWVQTPDPGVVRQTHKIPGGLVFKKNMPGCLAFLNNMQAKGRRKIRIFQGGPGKCRRASSVSPVNT